ncbi:MAG TPA: radical SAM family heme chaperone HemW [Acidobacteriaceae bacterium]|nr:radical SAM family heme chaperone HemW [Acidobacteriaceae bacterium]
MSDSLGVYISVPFCRAKCTYCNFASGVFGAERMDAYMDRVCEEIHGVRGRVTGFGGEVEMPAAVDSVYLGGGTPSLLSGDQTARMFAALRSEFAVSTGAEMTLECAPGQLSEETLAAMQRAGVTRVSLGVQSFVDVEAAGVGRLHTRAVCEEEIARLRAAGVENINVDLIAGLPRQTRESWRESVEAAIGSGVPHVSVYMLEVDEDSRLGREVMRAGDRYGAESMPSEDESAEWYAEACGWLEAAGVRQYEISNFAREGRASRHNIRYWRREAYLGFGLDAHSMLRSGAGGVRWANASELEEYLQEARGRVRGPRDEEPALKVVPARSDSSARPEWVGGEQAFEETMFLGLRMNEGVDLAGLRKEFGDPLVAGAMAAVEEMEEAGLVEREDGRLRLTGRGRMVSNEVFSRLLVETVA